MSDSKTFYAAPELIACIKIESPTAKRDLGRDRDPVISGWFTLLSITGLAAYGADRAASF